MLLPWNVNPEWPGVKVTRIVSAIDEVEGVTCLEAQRALLGPPRAVELVSRPGLARPLSLSPGLVRYSVWTPVSLLVGSNDLRSPNLNPSRETGSSVRGSRPGLTGSRGNRACRQVSTSEDSQSLAVPAPLTRERTAHREASPPPDDLARIV